MVCTLKEYRGSCCDGRVLLIRVQTMLNHFRFVFLPQYRCQNKTILSVSDMLCDMLCDTLCDMLTQTMLSVL